MQLNEASTFTTKCLENCVDLVHTHKKTHLLPDGWNKIYKWKLHFCKDYAVHVYLHFITNCTAYFVEELVVSNVISASLLEYPCSIGKTATTSTISCTSSRYKYTPRTEYNIGNKKYVTNFLHGTCNFNHRHSLCTTKLVCTNGIQFVGFSYLHL